jgi:hypothetical protein
LRLLLALLVALVLLAQPARGEPREDPPKVAQGVNAWDAQPAILWLSTERWHAAEPAPRALRRRPRASAGRSKRTASGACGGDLPSCAVLACESGGDLNAHNRSGADGKWQIMPGTWANYGGYANPSDAPESVQDERARQIYADGAGRSQWSC